MDLWIPKKTAAGPSFTLASNFEGFTPGNLRFDVLQDSGMGDQYLIQGVLDMGLGDMWCTLGIYAFPKEGIVRSVDELINEGKAPMWTVKYTDYKNLLPRDIREQGRELADYLTGTLPDLEAFGARHSNNFLRQAWQDPRIISYDEWRVEQEGKLPRS